MVTSHREARALQLTEEGPPSKGEWIEQAYYDGGFLVVEWGTDDALWLRCRDCGADVQATHEAMVDHVRRLCIVRHPDGSGP